MGYFSVIREVFVVWNIIFFAVNNIYIIEMVCKGFERS